MNFCVDTNHVVAVLEFQPLTPLPMMPRYMAGVCRWQGEVASIIDLRAVFNLPPRPPGASGCFIASRLQGEILGFWVDMVSDVVDAHHLPWQILPPACATSYMDRATTHEQNLVMLLDFARLLERHQISLADRDQDDPADSERVTTAVAAPGASGNDEPTVTSPRAGAAGPENVEPSAATVPVSTPETTSADTAALRETDVVVMAESPAEAIDAGAWVDADALPPADASLVTSGDGSPLLTSAGGVDADHDDADTSGAANGIPAMTAGHTGDDGMVDAAVTDPGSDDSDDDNADFGDGAVLPPAADGNDASEVSAGDDQVHNQTIGDVNVATGMPAVFDSTGDGATGMAATFGSGSAASDSHGASASADTDTDTAINDTLSAGVASTAPEFYTHDSGNELDGKQHVADPHVGEDDEPVAADTSEIRDHRGWADADRAGHASRDETEEKGGADGQVIAAETGVDAGTSLASTAAMKAAEPAADADAASGRIVVFPRPARAPTAPSLTPVLRDTLPAPRDTAPVATSGLQAPAPVPPAPSRDAYRQVALAPSYLRRHRRASGFAAGAVLLLGGILLLRLLLPRTPDPVPTEIAGELRVLAPPAVVRPAGAEAKSTDTAIPPETAPATTDDAAPPLVTPRIADNTTPPARRGDRHPAGEIVIDLPSHRVIIERDASASISAPRTAASGTPSQPGEPARNDGFLIHEVQRGDTLWQIAKHYLDNPYLYPQLARASAIRNPNLIYPGNVVRIEAKSQDEIKQKAPADR